MTQQLTSEQVWTELKKEIFAVLGVVNSKGEARTVGLVYIVYDHKIYVSTEKDAWKTRHIQSNPHVSITVPIAKRIPILFWIKIPQATITFSGMAKVFEARVMATSAAFQTFHLIAAAMYMCLITAMAASKNFLLAFLVGNKLTSLGLVINIMC